MRRRRYVRCSPSARAVRVRLPPWRASIRERYSSLTRLTASQYFSTGLLPNSSFLVSRPLPAVLIVLAVLAHETAAVGEKDILFNGVQHLLSDGEESDVVALLPPGQMSLEDRKSTRLNSSHVANS